MALERKVIIVCVTAQIIGLLSVVLGYAAEATKTQPSDLYILISGAGCVHNSSPAFGLALGAALLLLVAQVIASVFTRCGCCRQNGQQFVGATSAGTAQEGTNRTAAIIMFCISWVTFGISFFMFLSGAGIEATGANGTVDPNCVIVRRGIFATAATLSLATFSLSIGAYILQNNSNAGNMSGTGIALGQPQQFQQSAGPEQQFQQNLYAQGPQKPINQGPQYYPPPGTTPPGYGHNTQSYV